MQITDAKRDVKVATVNLVHEVRGSIPISAMGERVWAVLSDFHHVDNWAERVLRVEPIGEIAQGIGCARRCRVKGVGDIEESITQWQEMHTLGYRVTPIGPLGVAESLWTITDATSEECDVSLQLRYNTRFGWFGRIAHSLLVRRLILTRLPVILAALKHYVETGEKLTKKPANHALLCS